MYKILDIIDNIEKELSVKLDDNIKDILHEEYLDIEAESKREFMNDVIKHIEILQKKNKDFENSNISRIQ